MCVDTDTPIQAHGHPSHTLAAEGALGVHTVAVHAHPWSLTLINVYTHASTGVQQESRFTDTFEASVFVDAQSIQTHVPDETFILILAVFAVCGDFKSSVAHTVETTLSVNAAAVVADTTICHTFIQISALGPGRRGLESSRTLADVRAWVVDTFSMSTWVSVTLIIIDALPPAVHLEAHVALTAVSDAGHRDAPAVQTQVAIGLAHVGDVLSLDNWWRL